MKEIRTQFCVPAKRGMRVRYGDLIDYQEGTIRSAKAHKLMIQLDSDKKTMAVHPNDERLEYVPHGIPRTE